MLPDGLSTVGAGKDISSIRARGKQSRLISQHKLDTLSCRCFILESQCKAGIYSRQNLANRVDVEYSVLCGRSSVFQNPLLLPQLLSSVERLGDELSGICMMI